MLPNLFATVDTHFLKKPRHVQVAMLDFLADCGENILEGHI